MDYQGVIEYLQGLTDFEKSPTVLYSAANYDLRRLHDLLDRLGRPHLSAPTVHIAGTKGKGSTAALIAAALQEAGYRVGLYTSPHLHSFRERIAVNGRPLEAAEFAAAVEQARPHIDAINAHPVHGRISWFEALTVVAFLHFARQRAEVQVLETGLGGRLDATNVVPQPLVSVITSISLDHTQILGDTVAQIAREKAGIIKAGRPVVSSPQVPEALAVLDEVARSRGSSLVVAGRDLSWRKDAASPDG
ncbi:MAG: bifunctional folylpolyglutamate synthase/dihydrofolate synthase, partial [Chloroflexi bacterium]|nr:bifunctional folylpolyglutamate synthase/dihydrofolate synthase [Chloroflexota bacterium]